MFVHAWPRTMKFATTTVYNKGKIFIWSTFCGGETGTLGQTLYTYTSKKIYYASGLELKDLVKSFNKGNFFDKTYRVQC